MAEAPANLVLEHLRAMRADIRGEIDSLREEMRRGFSVLSQRSDNIETEALGVNDVATVSIGSVLVEIKDLKERVARPENA